MKIKTIAALALTALTIMPSIAAPEAALSSFKLSKQAKQAKRNKKLENRLTQGTYGLVAFGRQQTFKIHEAVCAGPACAFSYTLSGDDAFGFSVGTRVFITKAFIDGHALIMARLPKRGNSGAVAIAGFIDGDCINEGPISLCDHSFYETYLDSGEIHAR